MSHIFVNASGARHVRAAQLRRPCGHHAQESKRSGILPARHYTSMPLDALRLPAESCRPAAGVHSHRAQCAHWNQSTDTNSTHLQTLCRSHGAAAAQVSNPRQRFLSPPHECHQKSHHRSFACRLQKIRHVLLRQTCCQLPGTGASWWRGQQGIRRARRHGHWCLCPRSTQNRLHRGAILDKQLSAIGGHCLLQALHRVRGGLGSCVVSQDLLYVVLSPYT